MELWRGVYRSLGVEPVSDLALPALVITPESKQVRRAYPLYGAIQNLP